MGSLRSVADRRKHFFYTIFSNYSNNEVKTIAAVGVNSCNCNCNCNNICSASSRSAAICGLFLTLEDFRVRY